MPMSRPSPSVTVVQPRLLAVISISASVSGVPGRTLGMSASLCMTSPTLSSSRRPSLPPGWERAKSSAVKPRIFSRLTASASPSASVTVVLEVGARLSGQASFSTEMSRWMSASCPSGDAALPVIAISGTSRRRMIGTISRISLVEPELEMAMTTSSAVIMPRSPWLASPGWTKKAGEPVLASVAAILPPIWPDLPMPVTTMRPRQS